MSLEIINNWHLSRLSKDPVGDHKMLRRESEKDIREYSYM